MRAGTQRCSSAGYDCELVWKGWLRTRVVGREDEAERQLLEHEWMLGQSACSGSLGDLGLVEVRMRPLITNKGAVAEEGRAP